MNVPKKPRNRAVRLTVEGLGILRDSLVERWQADDRAGRLTRETRAELLGVSVVTSERILSGKGVDRSTLAAAFKNLGLPWDEAYCERLNTDRDRDEAQSPGRVDALEPTLASEPVTNRSAAGVILPVNSRRRSPKRYFVLGASLLCLVAAAGWRMTTLSNARSSRWIYECNVAFDDGLERFHQGDYKAAKARLKVVIEIAKKHDSASRLSSALSLSGDLAAAEGSLREARDHYRDALGLRNALKEDREKIALWEALGDVETRLGEYVSAEESLNQSLHAYERAGDRVGVAMVSRDLGTLAYRRWDPDAAFRWFQASLDAVKGKSKPDIEADVRGRKALVMLKQGQLDEAREDLRDCLHYWTTKKHPR